jgi:anaerobic magnesium-protoporphyrin IX monomethyl ester cyclase
MNVLLIDPPFYLFQEVDQGAASLGLAMLAAMADREGYNVKVYSPDLEHTTVNSIEDVITNFKDVDKKMCGVKDRLEHILKEYHPEVIGISFWTARVLFGLDLARHIKKILPDSKIIAGGVHATILPEDLLKSQVIDFVIRGEGEIAFVSLLEHIEKDISDKENIDNLSFIDTHGRIVHNPIKYCNNLDDLPFPGYEHFINCEKFDKNVFRSVMFSRGCPFDCNYCASYKLWSRKTRFHTPSYIVQMIKHIHQKFGTDFFQFDDDTFTLRKGPVFEICRLIKQEKLDIRWHCDTRVECISHELLAAMKEAGLETVAMGVESGDLEVRKIIRKTASLEATERAFKIAAESGVNTVGYFMIGFPGETYEAANRTLDFAEKLQPDIPCISICIPYPGTDSYQLALEVGSIEDRDSIDWSRYYHHSNINFSGRITEQEWAALLERCKKIDLASRERRLAKAARNITLRKVIKRYSARPYSVFSDSHKLLRILMRKLKP